ncbi:MAG: Jag N-terminal domain-containing protein [Clostridia bacterium]|nr:Jag N-terminal domain-containing protein [Clostridia bacterium]
MRTYEAVAKTTDEAIEAGLKELGVAISDVDVLVLEEGSKGLFGLFGSRPARVRLTVKEDEDNLLDDLLSEKKAAPEKKTRAEKQPAQERKPAEEKKPVQEKKPQEKKTVQEKKPAVKKPEQKKDNAQKNEVKAADHEQAENAPEVKMPEKPEVTMIPDDQLDPVSAAGVAKTFLQEVTKLMGVEVTIEMGTDADGNVYGKMNGDTLGILIGRRGETLDALQYLTSLKVNKGHEGYTRVSLDTENYRAKREDTLIRLANRYANRALKTGRKVSLEPMNPYERRIIHSALQQNDRVDTHSEGDEPNRHVVITVKK